MISSIKNKFKSEDSKRLFSNFISLLILQGANYILPLITLPYILRVLGAENYGILAFATALIVYFKILTDYGFNLTATRDISKYRDDKEKVIEIFSVVMTIKVILMFVSFLVMSIVVLSFEIFSQHVEVYFLTFGIVVGQVLFPIWFFQGMEQMKYISYLNILAKSIFAVAIFIFIQEKSDFYIVPLLTSIGFIVAGVWSLIIIKKEFKVSFRLQAISTIKRYFKDGWNIFLVDFLPNLYNNFSTFFLGFFVSMEILGYYSLATKLIEILNNFLRVIRNVTYPYLINNVSKFNKVTKVLISVGLFLTVCTISFSYIVIPFVFGEEMERSLLYLYILSLSPLLMAITFSYGTNKLIVLKKDAVMKKITFQYSIFGFLLLLIVIPIYGAIGSAVALISTRILMSILTYKKGKLL